ncbi:MAG: Glucosyltransferase-like protein [Chrysothrix sp. TS-e1954]|nr:MAG: Glucosyltransferase-like protein [Chrysothrix sp. TS-e1954]
MRSSASPSHKPRKKPRQNDAVQKVPVLANGYQSKAVKSHRPSFPLEALLWSTREGTSRWITLPLVLMVTGLYKWTLGFWGYSGFQSPPMHGDFEAQRHWMEITTHLPISQWYFYDLEWWGLDYPPLTAYHSWISGKIGALLINPSWFAFETSRGLDDPLLKVYMRATVLVSEYLVYTPALILFVYRLGRLQHLNNWEVLVALVAILMQPATMLIDHAHFQYNTVMLGFVAASFSSVLAGKVLWASAFFVAALSFKQMALYYAPAVFAYLLGACFFPRLNIPRFLAISVVTAACFGAVFSPLVASGLRDYYYGVDLSLQEALLRSESLPVDSKSWYYPVALQLAQSIYRIFPFARGIFEDKVANFWCALHTFHKLHTYSTGLIQKIFLAATALSILPPCVALGLYPDRTLLPMASATTAWGFFLFSFQVHEKSVLLPLLPMTLLLAGEGGLSPEKRSWITWANLLGCWTMFPLLKRDELQLPYHVLTLLWAWLMGVSSMTFDFSTSDQRLRPHYLVRLLHGAFYVAMGCWHVAEAFMKPPKGKPDLWVVANVLIGFAGFSICYLWCLWSLTSSVYVRRERYKRDAKRVGKAKVKAH